MQRDEEDRVVINVNIKVSFVDAMCEAIRAVSEKHGMSPAQALAAIQVIFREEFGVLDSRVHEIDVVHQEKDN